MSTSAEELKESFEELGRRQNALASALGKRNARQQDAQSSPVEERPRRSLSFLRRDQRLYDEEKVKQIKERKEPRRLFDLTRQEIAEWRSAQQAQKMSEEQLVPHGCKRPPIINKVFG